MSLIVDVTQLVGWKGKLTGIPRVMYELSTRFSKDGDGVIFVTWNNDGAAFEEIQYSEIEASRLETPASLEILNHYPLKRTLHKLYGKSPVVVKRAAKKAKSITVRHQEVIRNTFEFSHKDRLLVVWGDWGNSTYRSELRNLNTVGVDIYQIAYDMLPLVTPQYSSHSTIPLGQYISEIYPICKKIIAISEYTKKDIVEWMEAKKLHVPEIELIRLGDDFALNKPKKPDLDFFNSQYLKYIICVGTVETRKNHTLLYYVYKLAKSRGVELPKLVVVGRRGWLTENIYELITTDPDTKDSFIFMHDSSDDELAWLYKHSLFSIYPSHYEGWGLPIAESIAYGIPPVASNTSSMPEIAGSLITYFSPVSTDECLNAIQWILNPDNLNAAKKSIAKYTPTSWQSTFEQTKKIIES